MNLLSLVNRLRTECGVSGPSLTTVRNLVGENKRMFEWINSAWVDIQAEKSDWLFMRESLRFELQTQVQFYSAEVLDLGSFSNWKQDSFRISSVGANYADEQLTNYMPYDQFRNLYMYGNMRNTYTRPVVITIDPKKQLGFGAIPNQPYVVTGEYYTAPKELVEETDSPTIPDRFHMMLVYRAMMFYAGYEAAPEVLSRGQAEYIKLMQLLEIDQMVVPTSGPPLA